MTLDVVAESLDRRSHVRKIRSLISGQITPMTYKIDIRYFPAWYAVLIGEGKDCLAQCQYNATEWDIGSWCCMVINVLVPVLK